MCHGHPHHHLCGHQSVTWHYCVAAAIDLETGLETPCHNTVFSASQPSKAKCPLLQCEFKNAGSSWTCCNCNSDGNKEGWCQPTLRQAKPYWEKNHLTGEWEWIEMCEHGCCKQCSKDSSAAELAADVAEPPRKVTRRKQTSSNNKSNHRESGQRSSKAANARGASATAQAKSGRGTLEVTPDYGTAQTKPASS